MSNDDDQQVQHSRRAGDEWAYRLGVIEKTAVDLEVRVRAIENYRLETAPLVKIVVDNDRRLDELEVQIDGIQFERASHARELEATLKSSDRIFTRREKFLVGAATVGMFVLQILSVVHTYSH